MRGDMGGGGTRDSSYNLVHRQTGNLAFELKSYELTAQKFVLTRFVTGTGNDR